MKKSNLPKFIACGLMLTAILGTAVYATAAATVVQVYDGAHVYEIERYQNTYNGELASFTTNGYRTSTGVTVVNTDSQPRRLYVEAFCRNFETNSILDSDFERTVVAPGQSISVSVGRVYNNSDHKYHHLGKSYYYTNTDSVVIDNYQCIVGQ